MSRLSRYVLPVLKETPAEAQTPSHRLMLRAGMIRQLASGIYNWLPLGLRALRRVEAIVREELNQSGAEELLMPTMQPAELWQESGRGDYGPETLRVEDRHGRPLLYGPTNEEVITDLFRHTIKSYKQLPLNLYHIQWKFRDEIRPRFGVMRGREFLMKDAYTFDADEASAMAAYHNMYRTYLRIFKRMGLKAIPFAAETGLIGGSLSHEFQVIAGTGESAIYYDKALEDLLEAEEPDIEAMRACYAAADNKHDPDTCPVQEGDLCHARGIEVGHIFYFGEKYSAPMGAVIADATGKDIPVKMGAHGIGISRLVGAIIEAHHDEKGICWPESVAPFDIGLLNLRPGDEACDNACEQLYATLQQAGKTLLYADQEGSAGAKFATMDLIGLPWQVAIGPRGLAQGSVELQQRATGEKQSVSLEAVLATLSQ